MVREDAERRLQLLGISQSALLVDLFMYQLLIKHHCGSLRWLQALKRNSVLGPNM